MTAHRRPRLSAGDGREAPRRPTVDLTVVKSFDDRTLAALEAQGIGKVLVSCTPEATGSLPAHRALLLERLPDGWKRVALWRYPEADDTRWTPLLSASALCR